MSKETSRHTPEALLKLLGIEYIERPNRLAFKCCFHNDTDPSAGFYLDTGLAHCFSCDYTLDTIAFYARFHGVSKQEAERELSLAFGEQPKRVRVDPVEMARARSRGEAALAEVKNLPMEDHAFLGEQLDRTLLFFERGHLDKGKLDKCLEIWYNSVTEAKNAGSLKARTPILDLDARVEKRMGDLPESDGSAGEVDLD